ncbi:unnamed protein product [Paramecium sonneborni]|uniref:Calpain catalytic domain-containing protein n=1 Tax=Paramecium sonneborni TaxID=65129 RepID=A0A8S1PAB7_9CILI|nr:unnamed protein product [Paramecium sonneborni]
MGSSINTRAIENSAQQYVSETQYQPIIHETSNFDEQQLQQIKKPTQTNAGQQNENSNQENQNLKEMPQNQQFLFLDEQFPPNQSSISKVPNNSSFTSRNIVWKRPKEFLQPDQINLFDTIDPKDVIQGELGNCYFLSSLSALAQVPQIIERLFQNNKEYQQNGLYRISMVKNGILEEIIIDDYIPCVQAGPIFSRVRGNKLWVILLEKAYAKLYGSYDSIGQGDPLIALKDLTGAPSEIFQIEHANSCWEFMEKNNNKKYIQTASTKKDCGDNKGIVSSKCYSILDLQIVVGSDEQTDKIIKIRNPWGQYEWSGDWSDKSAKWTHDLIERFQVQQEDDGIFWMSIKDFITNFQYVYVAQVRPDYIYTSQFLKVENSDQVTTKLVKMNVTNKTNAQIRLTQSDEGFFENNNHNYSLARLIVGQLDSKNLEVLNYSGFAFNQERDIDFEKEFEPGSYVIYVEVDWDQNCNRNLAVSCYGSQKVEFQELCLEKSKISNILDGLLRAHGRFSDQVKNTQFAPGIQSVRGQNCGYLYFWYQNQTKNNTLQQEINFTQIKYLEISTPFLNLDNSNPDKIKIKIECKSNSNYFFKLRSTKEGRGSYSFGFNSSYSIKTEQQSKSEEDIVYLALLNPQKKEQQKLGQKNIQVFFYEVEFPDGYALLYENKESQIYKERIEFNLYNLKGIGIKNQDYIDIVIPPGQLKLIQLQKSDPKDRASYKLTSISIELK